MANSTTLGGAKVLADRAKRKLTRADYGKLFGVPGPTVQGWELGGRVPVPGTVTALARAGVADFRDWYRPAICPECDVPSDGAAAQVCGRDECPMAHERGAADGREAA